MTSGQRQWRRRGRGARSGDGPGAAARGARRADRRRRADRGQARRGCARRRHRPCHGAEPRRRAARGGRGGWTRRWRCSQRAKAAAPEAIGIMNAIGLCLDRLGRYRGGGGEYGEALARDPRLRAGARQSGDGADGAGAARRGAARFRGGGGDRSATISSPLNGLAALALRRGDAAEARRLAGAGAGARARLSRAR